MKEKIYKILLESGWTSKDADQSNNKRLGIDKCLSKDNYYCEIYKESPGFSIHFYGSKFMGNYLPKTIYIGHKEDLNYLEKVLKQ